MNKELKAKFTAFPTSLYNMAWVGKEADRAYKDFLKLYNEAVCDPSHPIKADNQAFALIFYGAFEYALNAFFSQVLDDATTQVELDVRDMHNIMAIFHEKDK